MIRRLMIILLLLMICVVQLRTQQISANQIYFQNYTSATEAATSWLSITCSTGYSIALDKGLYGSSVMSRMMETSNGKKSMGYQLFTNASHTSNWGNTPGAEVTGSATGNNNLQNVNIYAQIPALEAFSPYGNDRYTDTITATLTCGSVLKTTTLTVTVQEVDPGCGISANSLNFGNYTGMQNTASTTIFIGCSSGTSYSVGLNAGTAIGATVSNRSMTLTGGTALLNYKLLQGSYSGSNWGNSNGTDTVIGIASGSTQSLTVYGMIPAGQTVRAGTYTDTITATLTY